MSGEARRGQHGEDGAADDDYLIRKLATLPDSLKRAILAAREQAEAGGGSNISSTGGGTAPVPPQASHGEGPTTTTTTTTTTQPQPPPLFVLPPSFALGRNGAAVVDAFAPAAELRAAALEACALLDAKGRPAAMGGGDAGDGRAAASRWRARDVRGDESLFLSPGDAPPLLAALARRLIAALGPALRANPGRGWDDLRPGGRVELQLARYVGVGAGGPGAGSGSGSGSSGPPPPPLPRYTRHADNNGRTGASRRVTAVLYLGVGGEDSEEGWDAGRDGGELALYLPGVFCGACGSGGGGGGGSNSTRAEPALRVAPVPGRLAVFDSAVEHEVLPVTAARGIARVALTAWFHGGGGGGGGAAPAVPPLPPPLPPPPPPQQQHRPQQQPPLAADLAALILVTIASYRDPETPWTLRDVFSKASDPGRVRCAVVWQGGRPEGGGVGGGGGAPPPPKASSSPWWPRDRVREVVLPGDEACGPGVARHLALAALWRGEPLVLQIDSHTRLAQGWDSTLTLMLRAAEREAASGGGGSGGGGGPSSSSSSWSSRGAVVSTYPPPYEGAGASARVGCGGAATASASAAAAEEAEQEEEPDVTALCAAAFSERDGLLRLRCRRVRPSRVPRLALGRGPDPDDPSVFCPGVLGGGGGFWAAGFSFARAEAAALACCSPRLRHLFFGEEAYGLARLYTSGYDVFAPARCVAWHQWGETRAQRAERAAGAEGAGGAGRCGGAGTAEAAAAPKTYAALVAGDARAQRGRAASERRVRCLLAGTGDRGEQQQQQQQQGEAAAASTAARPFEPLWWWPPPPSPVDEETDKGDKEDGDDDEHDWLPGGPWGLGTRRPLAALRERCGVDFDPARRFVSAGARRAGLPPGSFEDDDDDG